jgi:hypothetical protein
MMFLRLHAVWSEPNHPTPRSQTPILLAGPVLVTASDGETPEIRIGHAWLMDDVHGKGHHTHVLGVADFDAVLGQHGTPPRPAVP